MHTIRDIYAMSALACMKSNIFILPNIKSLDAPDQKSLLSASTGNLDSMLMRE